jgi:ribosome biogenesis GTPase A
VKDEDDLEMLDSPGVIPASLVNQGDAALLAACNCIGEAAYDNQAVAAYLCDWLLALYRSANQIGERAAPDWPDEVKTRYKLDPFKDPELTGEDMLYMVAENTCKGNTEDASRKILQDFRTGRMGPICLQLAPAVPTGSPSISPQENESDTAIADEIQSQWKRDEERRKQERARLAFETAKNRGLELPPGVVANPDPGNGKATTGPPLDGKGLFEGW